MAIIDLMLIASIVAAALVTSCSIAAQKYFKIYFVFVGKKYAALVHAGLIGTAWAQVVALSYFAKNSIWSYSSVWFIGIPICAAALYIFVRAIQEIGVRSLYFSTFFNGHHVKNGPLYSYYKHPQYAAVCVFYIGLSLTTGRCGYLLAAALLAAVFAIFIKLEKPRKKSTK